MDVLSLFSFVQIHTLFFVVYFWGIKRLLFYMPEICKI